MFSLNRGLQLRFKMIPVLLAIFVTIVIHINGLTQEPAPTLEPGAVPNALLVEPAIEATAQALESEWMHEYQSRSIFNFNIAYLVTSNAIPDDSLMSGQSFAKTFGARIVHSWDDFISYNEQHPFQILLIHDSIYDQLDFTWTQNAYRNKVIIVGIGMPFDHLIEVIGDHCVKHPNPTREDKFASRMMLISYAVTVDNEDYRDLIDQFVLSECRDNFDLGDVQYGIFRGRTNYPLTDARLLTSLVDTLVIKSMDYQVERGLDDGDE